MKIKVLGCYGSEGMSVDSTGRSVPFNMSSFLVNDCLMIDAGTITTVLERSHLPQIKNVILSHIHLDHVKGLPFMAENLIDKIKEPVGIHSLSEVLEGVHRHLFNGVIWPDFTRLPSESRPIFRLSPLEEGKEQRVGDFRVTPIRVNHIVPTVGFLIEDSRRAFLYSGDTHETERIWEIGSQKAKLSAVFIETSFPNDLHQLALDSGHLTPQLLEREFRKIGRPDIPVYIYHMKPLYVEQITKEIEALQIPNFTILRDGLTLTLD